MNFSFNRNNSFCQETAGFLFTAGFLPLRACGFDGVCSVSQFAVRQLFVFAVAVLPCTTQRYHTAVNIPAKGKDFS
jgi:hypothetical protein